MIQRNLHLIIIISFHFIGTISSAQSTKVQLTHEDIEKWEAYGIGNIAVDHQQTVIWEEEGAVGYMLVSPNLYLGDVTVSYDVMPLNAATVLIVELSVHNRPDMNLEIPPGYDGNVKYLFDNVNMYMFAFHNAAHNKNGPFVRKWPEPGFEALKSAKKNYLEVGKYHHVELGIKNGVLFFEVNGKKVWKVKDENPFKGGKVILRLRGTAHEMGSCIVKNLAIESTSIK